MRNPSILAILALAVAAGPASGLAAQAAEQAAGLEARVWLDRGDEPLVRRGETVRIYYRTSEDAYAAIFKIDTDGLVSMIFPQHPGADQVVRGGRDFRLLFPLSPVWRVREDPGVGYFFIVASPEPLDFSAFDFDIDLGWDLSAVGPVVYEDPYVAIDDYVAAIVPDWEVVPYALDFVTYNVGDTYSYPRFLCYDCHDARPYATWNPYDLICSSYRVVIWDDPYFYPAYRYSGTHVVVARPARAYPRYEFTTRVAGGAWRPLVRAREAPPRRVVQYSEPAAAGPAQQTRRRPLTPRRQQAPQASQAAPSRPTLQRRPAAPSARLPARTPPAATGRPAPGQPTRGVAPSTRARPSARIVRPDRPQTRPQASPRTRPQTGPQTRPQRRPDRSAPRAAPRTPQPRASGPPSARSPRPSAGGARPRAPSRPSVGARPPSRSQPRARPSTGSRGATRSPAQRPTVRARPPSRGRGN